jgi:putative ABC transport system substrate-binding protein
VVAIDVLAVVAAAILALAAPPAAQAQQPREVVRLGFISSSTTDVASPLLAALREGLRDIGYEERKNLSIEYRFAESRDQLQAMAADLVKQRVAVILAGGSEGIQAAKDATTVIPIVMTNSGDAVRERFVASLRQPGGNITGLTQISPELAGKRMQMLKELVPQLSRVAVLWYPLHPNTPLTFRETRTAAEQLGLRLLSLEVKDPKEFDDAFTAAAKERMTAMIVLRDPFTVRHRALIAESAFKHRVPAIYETADYVQAGGLMFYGPDFAELYRHSATYVGKILKGAKPADLPVEQPTKFELVINMKTAKALGLTVPTSLLLQTDRLRIIE